MNFKKIFEFDYKKYNIPWWQSPQFVFLCLGFLIIVSILISFFIGRNYIPLEYLFLIICALTALLFCLSYVVVNSFQNLADANLMKTEFMNIISHQLKTPLTNIKWITEIAKRDKNTGKDIEEYFELVAEQNNRMLNLMNNMLVASRFEQNRVSFNMEKINIRELTEKVLKEIDHKIKANNIEVKINFDEEFKIMGDYFYLKQVIENLLDNAIDYSKSRAKVLIEAKKKDGNLFFSVKDEGVGIPNKDKDKVFQKFFRSSNVLKYQTQGLGLGLFIVKLIISQLGGKVGFKSKEGKGSIFWFELPLANKF